MTLKFESSKNRRKWQKREPVCNIVQNRLNIVILHIFKVCALSTSEDAAFATNAIFLGLVLLESLKNLSLKKARNKEQGFLMFELTW
jgi:hypothetical protein